MAIIYSYPDNTNILLTDMLIGTSTVRIAGKKKNLTKNFTVEALGNFISLNNPVVWGNIIGNLGDQVDLQLALDSKQDNIILTTIGSSGPATLIGSELNIPNYLAVIPTKTSDLINDGEDGIHPFITLEDIPPSTVPSLDEVLTIGNISIIDAKVGVLYSWDAPNGEYGKIQFDDNRYSVTSAYGNRTLFYADDGGLVKFSAGIYESQFNFSTTDTRVYTFPNTSGTVALTSDIPSLTGYALESWVISNFYPLTGNPSGFITSSALTPYLTSANAALTYYPIPTGTTLQYIRGDGSLSTFPTIPTVGTWGTLNYPTWTTGTPFVKMTAAGTFSLDTNIYLTSAVTAVGATSPITSSGGNTPVISTSMATNKLIGRSAAGTGVMEEITVGSGLTLSAGVLTNTATPTALGYYGAFQDNTIQTAAAINTPYAMKFGVTDLSNAITMVSDGSNLTRITIANTGIYNIQFSAQFDRTNSGTDVVDIWLRKNGVDVAGTGGKIVLAGGAIASAIIATWNYVLDVVAGDYYQLMWSTPDTHVRLLYEPAQTSPFVHPLIPSTILTVTQQSGIMAGTGITAINSLTGAAQTLTVGTTGTDFAIVDSGVNHKFNLPTASATNRGALSTTDWSAFNGKFNLPSLTSGSVLFSNGTTIVQDNSNFFFDDTNKRLNIGGIASNTARVGIKAPGTLSTDIALRVRNSADTGDLMSLNGLGALIVTTVYGPSTGGVDLKYGFGVSTPSSNNMREGYNGGTALNIGNLTAPVNSAMLQVNSTTQGFLPPRMTNAQRIAIATPAIGLCVYCTDTTEGLYVNKSTGWVMLL